MTLSRIFELWLKHLVWIFGALTGLAWWWGYEYYSTFYRAFGLTTEQVGLDRTAVLIRILPLVLGVPFSVAVFVLVIHLARRGFRAPRPPRELWQRNIITVTQVGIVVVGLASVFIWVTDAVEDAGRRDARHVITSSRSDIAMSYGEYKFGISNAVEVIEWVGADGENIFKHEPRTGQPDLDPGKSYTLGRILGSKDETTIFFDLYSCDVRIVPTINLQFMHGVTNYVGKGSPPSPETKEPLTNHCSSNA